MAPKRSYSASSPGKPSPKKQKLTSGQTTLHNFLVAGSRSSTAGASEEFGASSDSNAQDRKLAEQLAHQDGLDIETIKRMEASWTKRLAGNRDGNAELEMARGVGTSLSTPQTSGEHSTDGIKMKTSLTPSDTEGQACPVGHPSKLSIESSTSLNLVSHEYPDLTVDPLIFKIDAHPQWSPASYSFLSHVLSTLSHTRSRILILNTLTNYFRFVIQHHPPSLLPSLYLLSNSISPSYHSVELGLGSSIITKSLQQVSGLSAAALSKLYKSHGDPGDVAVAAKSSVRTLIPHAPLTTIGVYESLLKIAHTQGQGAAKVKQSHVEKLLLSAKGEESRYLVRTLCQNLRVGAVRATILSALSRAMVFSEPQQRPSSLYASPDLLQNALPANTVKGGKSARDPTREQVTEMFHQAEGIVKHAFVIHPNLNDISAALLQVGLDGLLEQVPLTVGIPLYPTLGSPLRSLDDVYERLGDLPFTAELKYDGQRAQVHAATDDNGDMMVKIFSRHLEDMTDKYPDTVALCRLLLLQMPCSQSAPKSPSFIMDAEIVAVDIETGELKSFQDLSQRARKDVLLQNVKVAVGLFGYDLMYLNEKVLPFRERRELLRSNFQPLIPSDVTISRFSHVDNRDSEAGRAAIEDFWKKAMAGRSEGLMIKARNSDMADTTPDGLSEDVPLVTNGNSRRKPLPATYEPDKRTLAWLKLKKDYVTGIGDSLDLVPIGAWHGNGRKAKWWSPILLAVWDSKNGVFVAVCKCMSGFSDAFYKALNERYAEQSDVCATTSLWNCDPGGYRPSVYFKPVEVWEIRGADITLSPISVAACGLIPGGRGLSLRFPRFIKAREDKSLEQASTSDFLADMWRTQESRGRHAIQKGVDDGDLVDVEWESDIAGEELDYEEGSEEI
ncbi:hypothetical protein BU17DRAFT_75690 [Hysterangium stoloniferum]|nr:hypothetical protein BU17DRAFT_75690 [Hysterangium stoloniferum]